MLRLTASEHRGQRLTRREVLYIGYLGLGGLTLADLLRLDAVVPDVCELTPQYARVANKIILLRSVAHEQPGKAPVLAAVSPHNFRGRTGQLRTGFK